MSARRMSRSNNTIDPDLAEAQTKITGLEQAKAELENTVQEKETTIEDMKKQLEAATQRASTAEANGREQVDCLTKEIQSLKSRLVSAEADAKNEEQNRLAMEEQLKTGMDGLGRMQTDLQNARKEIKRYEDQAKILHKQMSEALRDLTVTKDELLQERTEKEQLEEGKLRVEQRLEAMMAELRDEQSKVSVVTPQVWMTAAAAAVGTACVVSLMFMKYQNEK